MTAVIYARYSSDNGELKFWDVVVPNAIPQVGREPERSAAGVGGYVHQFDLPV